MSCIKSIVDQISLTIDKISPAVKATLSTIIKLIVNIIMSLLPLIILSLSIASENNKEFIPIFMGKFLSETMFIYCSAFIAPFFIVSISAGLFTRGRRFFIQLRLSEVYMF